MKDRKPNLPLNVRCHELGTTLNKYGVANKIYGTKNIQLCSEQGELIISSGLKKPREPQEEITDKLWRGFKGRSHVWPDSTRHTTEVETNVNFTEVQRAMKFLTAGDQDSDKMITQIKEREGCIVLTNPNKLTRATIPANEQAKTGTDCESNIIIPSRKLFDVIKRVAFIQSPPKVDHLQLAQVFLSGDNDKIEFMVTDGFRLSHVIMPHGQNSHIKPFTGSVEPTILTMAERLVSNTRRANQTVGVSREEDFLTLHGNPNGISARIPWSGFECPDWEGLVPPKGDEETITFDAFKLKQRMQMFKNTPTNTFSLEAKKQGSDWSLAVSQQITEKRGRKALTKVYKHDLKTAVPANNGFEGKIILRAKHLSDLLRHCVDSNHPQLELQIVDNHEPIMFKFPGDNNFVHLVMPRVS